MIETKGFRNSTKIAVGAIFAALVAAATLVFVVPIPATSGYFNLGETLIYIAALLFGPLVGTFAGAGAAIADMAGFPVFAPGTLVIKGFEGFIVGYLNQKLKQKIGNTTISAVISILIGGFAMILGYFLYEVAILSYPVAAALIELPFNVIQMIVGLVVAVPIMHAILRVFPQLETRPLASEK